MITMIELITNTNIDGHQEEISVVARMEKEVFCDFWSEESIISTMKYDYNYILIARNERNIVGYAIFSVIGDECELLRIAVDKEERRKNIAGLLMEKLFETAVKQKSQTIFLEVRKSNISAISLYKKLDFEIINTRKNYYFNPTEDGFILVSSLQQYY